MIVLKGQLVQVIHSRKGKFNAIADEDFDTDTTEFYPLSLANSEIVGMTTVWTPGESIPCRNTFCKISVIG